MRFIKSTSLLLFVFFFVMKSDAQKALNYSIAEAKAPVSKALFHSADNSLIQYHGRIQQINKMLPRFWSPGVYIESKFKGNTCTVFLNDEVLYGNVHNYIEIIIDNYLPLRLQTIGMSNAISIKGLSNGTHNILICKDTESGNGFLEFAGILCKKLLPLPPKSLPKIEFIGNSITCGFGADESKIPCGKGQWYDEHNAYMSYGPLTARALNADWQITAVSGIGMIHSCCGMKILMPQVYDKIDLRDDSISYDFNQYIPDLITICLGQNDGIQDSATFCSAYVNFIKTIRSKYENAKIILLTSPMADAKLRAALQNYLASIENYLKTNGDEDIYHYFFKNQSNHGCGGHPDLKEHQQISSELTHFIKENHLLRS